MIRKPMVSGLFYPDDPEVLKKTVNKFLQPGAKERAVAIMVPHAGYMYSGAVAGQVYSSVRIPDNIILIGPNHTGLGERASIMTSGRWEIPLGSLKINEELADMILDSSPFFSEDSAAHLMEHSLEVQIPFIYCLNKNCSIVPITLMQASFEECEEMGRAVAKVATAYGGDVQIVISSDMNHYEADKRTREKDKMAIERILKLDARGLLDVVSTNDITMCGIMPAVTAIIAARLSGAREARLVKYATSGDSSGDYTQVVGYAGVLIK